MKKKKVDLINIAIFWADVLPCDAMPHSSLAYPPFCYPTIPYQASIGQDRKIGSDKNRDMSRSRNRGRVG